MANNPYGAGSMSVGVGGVLDPNKALYGWNGVGYNYGGDPIPSSTSNAGVLGESAYGYGGSTGGSAYDQAIGNTQSAIDRLTGQQSAQQANIQTAYKNALDQLLSGKNRAEGTYSTTKTQTGQDYVSGKNTIGSQAGSSLSGLLRLLGSRGAGGGSAYQFNAPEAVARQATLQRGDLGQTFGRNMGALDTNWNNYLTDYGNSIKDVDLQKAEQTSTLQDTINTNRASLLQTLAQLTSAKTGNVSDAQPYLNQANSLLDRVGTYRTPAMNYKVGAYTAPSLDKYTSSAVTPTYQGQQASNDYFSPYLQALLGKKQQLI